MKTLKTLGITLILSIMMCVPVFAANSALVAGADGAYYLNGVKITSQWVDCGTYYGYAGVDGKIMTNLAIAKSVVGEKGAVLTIEQMKGAVANPVVKPNTSVPAVTPVAGTVTASLSEMTPLQRANWEDNYFRRHSYNFSYEQYDSENHKAFCACGEWAITPHNWVKAKKGDKEYDKCSLCGQS